MQFVSCSVMRPSCKCRPVKPNVHCRQHIDQALDSHTSSQCPGSHLAALIIEPLVQGAGGMLLVDPQFQRQLVQVGWGV
jgi:adenosylmethionine-8-amino-7-oxononanoate aminotransferase